MARLARLLTGIALVALIGVGLAACGGGGGGGGEDRAQNLSARQLLAQSSTAAEALTSFRVALEATGQVDLPAGTGGIADLVTGPIDISGEGPVQPPDRASLDVKVGLSGLPLQGNVTRVGDEVYLGFLGQDFQVNLPPEQVALFNLGALYPTLVDWARNPVDAGREDIDGTSTVKVTADLDAAAALTALAPALGVAGVTPAEARAALTTGRFEAWIGTEDLLPRRVHVVLAADGAKLATGAGDINLDLTVNLSAFDEPVDITAPENARPLNLNDLGSLVGG